MPKDAKARAAPFKGPTRTIPFTVSASDGTPLEGVTLEVASYASEVRRLLSASTTDALRQGEARVPASSPAD